MENKRSIVWTVARWLAVHIPRTARIEVLDAFAYPEFEMARRWYKSPGVVTLIPLDEALAMEQEAQAWLASGGDQGVQLGSVDDITRH